MDTLPWAKFWNRTGYFLADECVSSSVNYFNSTWKQLVTFYGCWCSAAQLDQFNWSRLSSESRQKSLFSLNQWESYCQPQYGWECAVWISDNIYATIALKIHCVDGKFFIAWWKFKIFNIHHSFSFKSCNFFWYIYFLRMQVAWLSKDRSSAQTGCSFGVYFARWNFLYDAGFYTRKKKLGERKTCVPVCKRMWNITLGNASCIMPVKTLQFLLGKKKKTTHNKPVDIEIWVSETGCLKVHLLKCWHCCLWSL